MRTRARGSRVQAAGQLALLYVAARLLHRIDKGQYPDLAAPLRKLVETF
ncbi:hypothetical protein [Lentzea kentuckyensis]|nr:hypothetical protein [Lentzea kentuckyensis]